MRKWKYPGIVILALIASSCSTSPQQYVDKGNGFFKAGRYAEADLNYQKALQKDPNFGEALFRYGMSQFAQGKVNESYKFLNRASEVLPNRDDVLIALGDAAFASYIGDRRDANRYGQVQMISRRLIQVNANSFDGLRLQGYIFMIDNHYPEAIVTLKKADAIKAGQPEVVDSLMQCLFSSGKAAEAEKLGLDLIQHKPTAGTIYDTLYRYYVTNRRLPDAEALMRRKVDANPSSLTFHLQLAGHYASAQNEAAMLKAIQAVTGNPSRFPGVFLEVGDFYFSLKRFDEALRAFQAGVKQDAQQKLACQKRTIEVFIVQKKWDQALAAATEMLKTDARNFDARALRAEIHLDAGTGGSAAATVQDLRDLIVESPDNAVLHYNLGRAYLANSENDSALAEFNQAMKLDARYLQPRMFAANLTMEREDYLRSGQIADEILGLTGDNASARLVKAASLTGMGNFNEAAKALNQLAREFPNSSAPKLQNGELMRRQKNYKEAESIFRGLYEKDRSDLVALTRLMDTYYEQGKYDAAIQYLTRESAGNSSSAQIRDLLADAALRGKNLDLAVKQYAAKANAEPGNAMAHLKLGDAYLQQGNSKDAISHFETARKLAPRDPMVNAMLALSFHNSGRAEDAQKAYRDTLALKSNNPEVKNNLAYLMAETGGNLDEALKLAMEAHNARPTNMALSDTVGWIYYKKKDNATAIQMLTNVVQKEPRQAVYHYHLAAALYDKGDRAGARKELQEAMNTQPPQQYEGRIRDLLAKVSN